MTEMRRRPIELADSPEHRAIPIDTFDIEDGDDNTLVIKGYASTFQPYEMYGGPANGYGWIEQIARGAFERTLKENPDLHLLINHEGLPLARTKSGNLFLSVDDHGLHVVAHLDRSDPDVQRLEPKMRRGDMDEMSFAFRVKGQTWESTPEFKDDPEALRTITEVSLHKGDVSVVNWGANPTTSVSIDRALAALADCDPRELVEARADDAVLLRAKANLANVGVLSATAVEAMTELLELPTGTVVDGLLSAEPAEDRADADDDPAALIAALDATLDEAIKLTADVDHESLPENVAQALDLLNGADTIVDKLMEVSGVYDPDDDDADRANADESETRDEVTEADAEGTAEESADERSEETAGITIPVHADLSSVTEGIARMAEQFQSLFDGFVRALSGVGADEQPTEEAADEAADEEREEAPKGMTLRELRVLEGVVPDDGPLTLAELRALES